MLNVSNALQMTWLPIDTVQGAMDALVPPAVVPGLAKTCPQESANLSLLITTITVSKI